MRKTKPKVLAVLLALLLVFLSCPASVMATETGVYANPSHEEIARKLEITAREKGIPSVILKAIAFGESSWRQFDKNGNVVINASGIQPAIGIMQVASYNPADTDHINRLKYDIDYNIACGADILNEKWNRVPVIGDGDRNKLENWYFALWAYNSWAVKNNPNNAVAMDKKAYQDKIIDLAAKEYLTGVVTPVQITPLPRELFPLDTLPGKDQTWNTPEPYTLGDLRGEPGDETSRGEQPATGSVSRIAGQTHIDTVNQIALGGWPDGAETVIIARSDEFPDALAGVPLAQKYNAPILVTNPDELEQGVIDTLNKLQPLRVIILGGEGAVRAAVETRLKEVLDWAPDIERIAGLNRYETAALIAAEFPHEQSAAIATGADFPDAIALAAAAAANGIPLLLTAPNELPEATRQVLADLQPQTIYAAGGEAVVSPSVLEQIAQETGLAPDHIIRFAGSDRYETCMKIAEYFYPDPPELYLATGMDFADPLAAGALAAKSGSCLLLVSQHGIPVQSPLESFIKKQRPSTNVKVIGGESIIADDAVKAVQYLLQQL